MTSPTALIIGGTGAQGVPIVEELANHGFQVRVLTRDVTSSNAKKLSELPNVTFSLGAVDSVPDLKRAFRGIDYAFVNLNSWSLGIKDEIFWGIRIFEIAVQSGVKHYIWSSLDNFFLETKYDDSFRSVHYYGKGHVEQWISALPQSPMRWTILATSPYLEQLWGLMRPTKGEDGVYDFRFPVNDGGFPLTCLDDMGYYVPKALTEATGLPAKGTNIELDQWFEEVGWGPSREHKMGSTTAGPNDPTLHTVYESFSGWWKMYQHSINNTGLIKRDYALLDEIHPHRTRSVREWMQKVHYDADKLDIITVTAPMAL
ncbi:nmrA-like family domain-containing protein [Trichoderma breve]|uniref:NmrA-like family domain-containing protein n=1 Tax=Trichoderma breve TaxID=2034170 RepID=A0A9W9EB83_9HYPO|nr:nmrA-like family domain-containing protein [Trichoderma breve]KAJ4863510.1 nmrA-like family domain-containing protein [Trichoderma breve]